ncbi:MAG: hypothetical protein ACT4QA_22650 [Panacagrimonas sp.]
MKMDLALYGLESDEDFVSGIQMEVYLGGQGPPGPAGVAETYLHTQSIASTAWTINHNRGAIPGSVTVYSVGGMEVNADVIHTSNNQTSILFSSPYAGFARLI